MTDVPPGALERLTRGLVAQLDVALRRDEPDWERAARRAVETGTVALGEPLAETRLDGGSLGSLLEVVARFDMERALVDHAPESPDLWARLRHAVALRRAACTLLQPDPGGSYALAVAVAEVAVGLHSSSPVVLDHDVNSLVETATAHLVSDTIADAALRLLPFEVLAGLALADAPVQESAMERLPPLVRGYLKNEPWIGGAEVELPAFRPNDSDAALLPSAPNGLVLAEEPAAESPREAYLALLDRVQPRVRKASVVLRPDLGWSHAALAVLRQLRGEGAVEGRWVRSWPGTNGPLARLYEFVVGPAQRRVLRAADGFWSWQQPERPEDLALLDANGQVLVATTAHEQVLMSTPGGSGLA